ncbi:MAG: hypothetical protein QGD94_06430, partial [Planctomycetia bacterium]|nr:hypothetical protein [Planctomycetia bacterium]
VVVAARDDVEVARIILLRSINGWAPTEAALKLEAPGPTYATAKYLFDLSVHGARAGDVITYYASAYDVYPGSAHFSDTPTFVIRVISEEEYLQYARAAYRTEELIAELEDFLRRIEELDALRKELLKQAEELERKIRDSGGKLSDADMEELRQFARDQDEYADRMRELADRMLERVDKPTLYEFEASFKDMLKRMAQDLRGQAAEMSALTLSFDQLQKRGLRRLPSREYLQDSIAQLRGAEEFMDNFHEEALLTDRQLQQLQKADELVALTEVIVAITEQQRELADRLGQFRNKERLGPAEQIRARRMAQEQAELRAQLQAALEEMDTKAAEAQDILPKMSASLRKIVADIRRLNVLRDQDNAATLAHAGRGRYAWPAADDAAAKLESLFEECGGTQGMMARAAEDLDRALKLTKQKRSRGLQQWWQSRGMPGTRQSGTGGAGGGYYGSRAQLTLMGPHASGGGESDARRGRGRRGRGRGAWRPAGRKEPEDAESITPEADVDRSRDVRGTLGVPVRYRGLAEEYFRRLADESK